MARSYSVQSPTHFVVVKMMLPIVEGEGWEVGMATEMAVVGVVGRGGEEVRVAGNMLGGEVVMGGTGKVVKGGAGETVQQISEMVALAT